MTLKLKRAYEAPSPGDGVRFLVERLWPRGVSKQEARLDGWLKQLAPSTELRKWFGHDPERWQAFQSAYRDELSAPSLQPLLNELAAKARAVDVTVTLVYGSRDTEHNAAVVLKSILEEMAPGASSPRHGAA